MNWLLRQTVSLKCNFINSYFNRKNHKLCKSQYAQRKFKYRNWSHVLCRTFNETNYDMLRSQTLTALLKEKERESGRREKKLFGNQDHSGIGQIRLFISLYAKYRLIILSVLLCLSLLLLLRLRRIFLHSILISILV